MKYWYLILKICALLCIVSAVVGQKFPCDGQLLIATTDGISTSISRKIDIPFNPPFLSPIVIYQNGNFDAIGFNSKDNFIYGVQENTNAIVKLKRDNSFEQVGTVPFVDTLKANAGDCTPEGLYLCHAYDLHQILVFDVVDEFKLIRRIDLFWDPDSPNDGVFETRLFDFAIDPNNPSLAFSYQGHSDHEDLSPESTRGYTLRINLDFDDPNLGMVTPIAAIDQNQITHLGGMLFTAQSDLFGYGSSDPGLNPPQNRLFTISPFTGEVIDLKISRPKSILSDGCSCPFSFTFTNSVPEEGMYCNNDEKIFVVNINNNSFNPISDIILRDTFPEGMVIEQITGLFEGSISAGTGIGMNVLEIVGLQIPSKTNVEIRIKVLSVDAPVGPAFNQAYLYNLKNQFEEVLASDNLSTIGAERDASQFIVIPRRLDDVTWEVVRPSDCIEANDGQIVVSSPQFFPGQEYEVKLRNKIGWEESTTRIVIDQNNSFLLDSLVPGDYQLFQVRSLLDNCSLAVQDTTLIVEAPNDLLDLIVSSNSPICEGAMLLLQSEVFPAGDIQWKGPNSYGSEDFNPVIENVMPKYSGAYTIEAEYGLCKQINSLEVTIKPNINASIVGETQYCEREGLLLNVTGKGDTLEFQWSGPNNLTAADSILSIPSMTIDQQGYYEVVSTNGACNDTVGLEIIVRPTPTIRLQEVLLLDFCVPVILSPEITGGENVRYSWFPQEGLSCADCPSPQVVPIVQDRYQLYVENDQLCNDSATVDIVLDQKNRAYAPNAFVRQSERGNERFTLFPGCILNQIHSLEIFDRWGNRVFTSKTTDSNQAIESWDGKIHGQLARAGVYVWYAEIELVDGSIQNLKGDVTLLEN